MILDTIGIDPGPICGVVGLYRNSAGRIDQRNLVMQINPDGLGVFLKTYHSANYRVTSPWRPLISCEKYVLSQRSGRSTSKGASLLTIQLIGQLREWANYYGWQWFSLPNGVVKPWATDDRLAAAGLLDATKGMADHARSAARHALYGAVKVGRFPDPLSRKAKD